MNTRGMRKEEGQQHEDNGKGVKMDQIEAYRTTVLMQGKSDGERCRGGFFGRRGRRG